MTRRSTPLLATASVVCAFTLSPCLALAQTEAGQQVSSNQTQTLRPDFTPASSELSSTNSDFVPSLGQVFTKTLGDFRRLPSLDSAVILGMGGAASMLGHSSDNRLSHSLSGTSSGFFSPGTMIGASTVQLGAAFATYSLGRATGHPKVAAIGADLVSAQIVSQTLTQAIKFSVGRTRPDGTAYSFPSGHSATAFATAAVLQRHLGWKVGIPAYTLATYVAASRIETQRHYLSDVAFGAAIGMISGRTVTLGRGNARFAVSPAAAPGGGGVNFTWVGKK
jgi:membrane-associated phospholipid phosphatase